LIFADIVLADHEADREIVQQIPQAFVFMIIGRMLPAPGSLEAAADPVIHSTRRGG
jgi:hypothetical protein